MRLNTVDEAFDLLERRAEGRYGLSGVSQLDHALQSAALAVERGLGDAMTIAALFHDIGHLLPAEDVSLAEQGIDDRHEDAGAAMLERLFVFGTLGPGRPNEQVLRDIGGTWEPATVTGTLRQEGCSEATALNIIDTSRTTYYRGLAAYRKKGLMD